MEMLGHPMGKTVDGRRTAQLGTGLSQNRRRLFLRRRVSYGTSNGKHVLVREGFNPGPQYASQILRIRGVSCK